jgi:hypothetical protein
MGKCNKRAVINPKMWRRPLNKYPQAGDNAPIYAPQKHTIQLRLHQYIQTLTTAHMTPIAAADVRRRLMAVASLWRKEATKWRLQAQYWKRRFMTAVKQRKTSVLSLQATIAAELQAASRQRTSVATLHSALASSSSDDPCPYL